MTQLKHWVFARFTSRFRYHFCCNSTNEISIGLVFLQITAKTASLIFVSVNVKVTNGLLHKAVWRCTCSFNHILGLHHLTQLFSRTLTELLMNLSSLFGVVALLCKAKINGGVIPDFFGGYNELPVPHLAHNCNSTYILVSSPLFLNFKHCCEINIHKFPIATWHKLNRRNLLTDFIMTNMIDNGLIWVKLYNNKARL